MLFLLHMSCHLAGLVFQFTTYLLGLLPHEPTNWQDKIAVDFQPYNKGIHSALYFSIQLCGKIEKDVSTKMNVKF